MENKKIVILISSLFKGGAERVAVNISNGLSRKKYRVFLITLDKECDYEISEGVKHYKISNVNARANKFIKLFYTPYQIFKLKKVLRDINPSVVLTLLERPNFLSVCFLKKTRYKSIISVHNFASQKYKEGLHGFISRNVLKYIVQKAYKIITVSKGIRDDLIENFKALPEKTIPIHNFHDIEKIQKLSKEKVEHLWFTDKIPLIINMGRLVEQKGQWQLIRAFSLLRKKQKARLVILGEGKLKKYLEKLVFDLKLTDDIVFLGWQKNPFKYIAKATIFALSSLYEGCPNALTEAMICGVPVISSDCRSGPKEILENGKYGILVPTGENKLLSAKDSLTKEEEILANEMINLLKDKELREEYKNKALERVKAFSEEVIIPEYEKILFD